jgi:hypothetical protein
MPSNQPRNAKRSRCGGKGLGRPVRDRVNGHVARLEVAQDLDRTLDRAGIISPKRRPQASMSSRLSA